MVHWKAVPAPQNESMRSSFTFQTYTGALLTTGSGVAAEPPPSRHLPRPSQPISGEGTGSPGSMKLRNGEVTR